MFKRFAALVLVGFCLAGLGQSMAQEGLGERLGERIDRGVSRLGEQLREGWAEMRQSVDRLSLEGRVYARLHWDKQLADATIDIGVRDKNIVVLEGSVPDQRARDKAAQLAGDTVGVKQVVNNLAISP